jgi:hypothetical protein
MVGNVRRIYKRFSDLSENDVVNLQHKLSSKGYRVTLHDLILQKAVVQDMERVINGN